MPNEARADSGRDGQRGAVLRNRGLRNVAERVAARRGTESLLPLERLRREVRRTEADLHSALDVAARATDGVREAERALSLALDAAPERGTVGAGDSPEVESLRADWLGCTNQRTQARRAADEAAARALAVRSALRQAEQRVTQLKRGVARCEATETTIRRRIALAQEELNALERSLSIEAKTAANLRFELAELTES